jgi:hypothetical protein
MPRHALGQVIEKALKSHNHAILVVSVPIFSIQIFTTSPTSRNSPRADPTPAGVPVAQLRYNNGEAAFEACALRARRES